ncbi:MAG: JAB domain-containing protein [Myxococcota bacterium]
MRLALVDPMSPVRPLALALAAEDAEPPRPRTRPLPLETLAALLGRGQSARRAAEAVLRASGGLAGLANLDEGALRAAGLTPLAVGRLRAALGLHDALLDAVPLRAAPLTSSQAAFAALGPRLGRRRVEHFVALPLDAKARPMGEVLVAKGTRTACLVEPADAYRPLVLAGAVSVLFAHNHPSGDPAPSVEDLALTARLHRAGSLLGIEMVDHLIVGAGRYFSFRDADALEAPPP